MQSHGPSYQANELVGMDEQTNSKGYGNQDEKPVAHDLQSSALAANWLSSPVCYAETFIECTRDTRR
jgi:hypothetical protein